MNANGTALPLIDKIRSRALVVGLAGAALAVVGAVSDRRAFDRAYLFSFVFVLGMTLGSMALLMLHRQLGGAWGFLVRRPLEAAAMTIPLVALFFIPVLIDLDKIYRWVDHPPGAEGQMTGHDERTAATTEGSHPASKTELPGTGRPVAKESPVIVEGAGKTAGSLGVRRDPLEADTTELFKFKRMWLDKYAFTVRAAIYFFIWIVMAAILNIGSRRQDETRSVGLAYGLQSFSAPGIVVYFLTTSLALIDWGMSLEPDWYSSLYGVLLIIGQGLSAISLMIIMTALLARRGETDGLDTNESFNDLGNLMLAFTMLWGYLSFSQYLIIWSGNLAEEIPWYARRLSYGWANIGRVLMLFHFAVPFLILLARPLKRNINALWKVAALMLSVRLLDVYWQITPSFNPHPDHDGPLPFLQSASWQDLAVPAGMIGLWFSYFLYQLRGKTLMVVQDPELMAAFKQARGH